MRTIYERKIHTMNKKILALLAAAALWCAVNLGELLYAARDVDRDGLTRGFFALLTSEIMSSLVI